MPPGRTSLIVICVAAVAPAGDVTVVVNEVDAHIGDGATVNAAGDVYVVANSTEEIVSVAAAIGAAVKVSVAGSVAVLVLDSSTQAYIGAGAHVLANGNVLVSAFDDTSCDMIAGSAGVSLLFAGVGASVGVAVLHKDTQAYIDDGAYVAASEPRKDGQAVGF